MPTDEEGGYDAVAIADIHARQIAREEIASLAGLMLRRLQDIDDDEEHVSAGDLSSLWGEALADFSSDSAPGGRHLALELGDELQHEDEIRPDTA